MLVPTTTALRRLTETTDMAGSPSYAVLTSNQLRTPFVETLTDSLCPSMTRLSPLPRYYSLPCPYSTYVLVTELPEGPPLCLQRTSTDASPAVATSPDGFYVHCVLMPPEEPAKLELALLNRTYHS